MVENPFDSKSIGKSKATKSDPNIQERLRSEFQILSETGISADYFNTVSFYNNSSLKRVIQPHIPEFDRDHETAEEKNERWVERENWVRENVAQFLPTIRTYSEWVDLARGNLPRELFITEKNKSRVAEIDVKALELRNLYSENIQDINLVRVNRLAFEIALLIYGDNMEATLRKRYLELTVKEP